MANGITRYYPQPKVVQLIFGQPLSQRPMARMLNLGNIFELVINGFNDAAFSQQNLT